MRISDWSSDVCSSDLVLRQRQQALNSTQLRAPMSGIVKNVRITTMGAVLKSGEELMQIVPSDEPLLIEAKVKSADVAFIRLGLHANVKQIGRASGRARECQSV